MTAQHESFRELTALRLYDELDGADAERLEAHLSGCAECREYAAELEAGLGACSRPSDLADLPAGWRERLAQETRPVGLRLLRPALTFAAGLAAGLVLMAFIPDEVERVAPASAEAQAGRTSLLAMVDGPPPLATGGGSLGMLGSQISNQ